MKQESILLDDLTFLARAVSLAKESAFKAGLYGIEGELQSAQSALQDAKFELKKKLSLGK